MMRRTALLMIFVILFSVSTVITAKAQDLVCAKSWSLQTWWDEPAVFKYSPVVGNTVDAQFKSKLTYGLFAPQLSNEARELIRKQGKDIAIQFFISRKNDLNFDSTFRPIYSPTSFTASNISIVREKEYTSIPFSPYPFTIFPKAELATRIMIEQPNCDKYEVTSPYHSNPDFVLPKMGSEEWNNFWKAMTRDFKQLDSIRVWEKTFSELEPKPISIQNSVGSNRWYELFRTDLLGPNVFNYDWRKCPSVKTISEYEKDFYKASWEMVFLEAPIYGVGLLTTQKSNSPITCKADIYFMLPDWYGEQATILFYLGEKSFIVPGQTAKAGSSPDASASPTPKPSASASTSKSSKSITCVKGKSILKVSGSKPKCPSGYKVKK